MADIVFIAIALAFFALCALYVRWCDRIIGTDEVVVVSTVAASDPDVITEMAA